MTVSGRPNNLTALTASALLLLAGACTLVSAQEANGSFVGPPAPNSLVGPSILLAPSRESGIQSEILFGRGIKGPYLLLWKNVRVGSETVVRDGATLRRDNDYTFDAEAGSLAFTEPLRPNQMVRLTYRADNADAVRNPKALNAPLQWNLWQGGKTLLTLDATPNSDPKAGDAAASLSTLNLLTGTRIVRGANVASGLFLDLRGGNLWERGGIKLGETNHFAIADLNFNYQRAGTDFTQQEASGLRAGRELMETTGTLRPYTGLTLASTLRQTTDTTAATDKTPAQATTTREFGNSVAYALPKDSGKIEAGRVQTFVGPPEGPSVNKVQDTLNVERTLTKGTQATVGFSTLTTTPDADPKTNVTAPATYSQQTSVDISSKIHDLVTLKTNYRNTLGSALGAQDAGGLHLEATPIASLRDLKLTAGFDDQFGRDGAKRKREALLELPTLPIARARLSGGYRVTSSPTGERQVGLMDAALRPARFLELSGGVRLRDGSLAKAAPDPDAVNTYTLRAALAPWNRLKLTGNFVRNPESDDGAIRKTDKQALGMETAFGSWTLRGQYGLENEYLATRLTNTMELGLDLRLTGVDTLTTGFQARTLYERDITGANTYLFGFAHKLGSLFDLSLNGTMTLHNLNGTTDWNKTEIKADARVGLHF